MSTLAISCLTISNLSCFIGLTFQIPMQHCSLHHWTLLSPPDTSSTVCCFCLPQPLHSLWSFFLSSSPVVYWAPINQGSVISFCLFILFLGFSRQECCSGLTLSSPVHPVLSEMSTMTCPSWVALQAMAHNFT